MSRTPEQNLDGVMRYLRHMEPKREQFEQATRWQQALQAALPDVKAGDRLLGIHQPGVGATFKMGGRVVGEVPDAEFSRLFFGIWLSPQTSEPGLRQQLLAATRTAGQP